MAFVALVTPTVRNPIVSTWTELDQADSGAAGYGYLAPVEVTTTGEILAEASFTVVFPGGSDAPAGLRVYFAVDGVRQANPSTVYLANESNTLRPEMGAKVPFVCREVLDLEDDTYDISVEIDYLGDVYLDAAPGVLVISDL